MINYRFLNKITTVMIVAAFLFPVSLLLVEMQNRQKQLRNRSHNQILYMAI